MTRSSTDVALAVGFIGLVLWWLSKASQGDSLTPSVTTSETFNLGITAQLRAVAAAIARAEGYAVSGSVPNRANNPGDLKLGGQTIGEGITVFATPNDGWNALYNQLVKIVNGTSAFYTLDTTIAEMGLRWSGSTNWAPIVAGQLGVPTSTPLYEVLV